MTLDYVLNIFNEEEFLFAIGDTNMNYDNILWIEIKKLIEVINTTGENELNNLSERIKENTEYFQVVLNQEYEGAPKLNIANKTIEITEMPVYDFDEVNKYFTFKIVERDGKYIQVDDEEYEDCEIQNINCNMELLTKKVMTFEELFAFVDFLNSLEEECFVIDKKKVLILNQM